MWGPSVTSPFASAQAIVFGALLLALLVTAGVSLLGPPVQVTVIAFVLVFFGLMALAWPLVRKSHPDPRVATRE